MIYSEVLEDIKKQNKKIQEQLGFQDILKNQKKELIYKILDTNFCRYKNQIIQNIDYILFLDKLYNFIDKNFINKDELDVNDILTFHKLIFSIYGEKELENDKITNVGKLREVSRMTYNLDKNGKLLNRNYFISENKVKKEFNKTIINFNNSDKNIYDIIVFFSESITKIHPFENGNGRVFFNLLDILLIKYNLLPLFIQQNKKEYDKILNNIYFHDYNFKIFILNFLKLILNKYDNYQIK